MQRQIETDNYLISLLLINIEKLKLFKIYNLFNVIYINSY